MNIMSIEENVVFEEDLNGHVGEDNRSLEKMHFKHEY